MQRTQRNVTLLLGSAFLGLAVTGCFQSDKTATKQTATPLPAAPTSNPVAAATPAPPSTTDTAFVPYTVIPQLPPKPEITTPQHGRLHLTHINKQVVLVDGTGRVFHVGRDSHNHLYPIYREANSNVTYPLYYDRERDSYYRVARDDSGHYLRGYVDQPSSRYYRDNRDYERLAPSDIDQPTITNYNTYNDDGQSRPVIASSHHSNNNNWLWAIPVVIGAYYLLKPHHHSSPQPVYNNRPNRTVIVNNYYNDPHRRHDWDHGHPPVTVVNNHYYNTAHPVHTAVWQHPVGRPVLPTPLPNQVAFQHTRPHPQRSFGDEPRPIIHQAAHVTTHPHPRFVLQHPPVVPKPFVRPQAKAFVRHDAKPKPHFVASSRPAPTHINHPPRFPERQVHQVGHPIIVHMPLQAQHRATTRPHRVAQNRVEPARHENRPTPIHPAILRSKPTLPLAHRNDMTRVISMPRHPMSEARPQIQRNTIPTIHRDIHTEVRHENHVAPRVVGRPTVPVVERRAPEPQRHDDHHTNHGGKDHGRH